jgi:hypothetical protein
MTMTMDQGDDEIKYAHEYEEYLGEGRVKIFEGHPNYCPKIVRHAPHTYHYRFLPRDGTVVIGNYYCDGWARLQFSARPGRFE